MASDKRVFVALCLAVWFVNAVVTRSALMPGISRVWSGLLISLVTVPIWAFVGLTATAVSIFLFRFLKIDIGERLTLWQKADVGLAIAVVLKPALGIPF